MPLPVESAFGVSHCIVKKAMWRRQRHVWRGLLSILVLFSRFGSVRVSLCVCQCSHSIYFLLAASAHFQCPQLRRRNRVTTNTCTEWPCFVDDRGLLC